MKKKIYFENLDGLRFLCFLSVFFFHSFHTDNEAIQNSGAYKFITESLFVNGNLGVNFFFVLSGFLITYLLLEEKRMNGQIDIKKFWMRRILRIWPLFFLCVFFGFFIFPLLKSAFGQEPSETATIWYYLSFTNNFDLIRAGLPDASILGVLWSVAVEEQFYLVWPLVLYVFPIKKSWIAFVVIIVISLVFRYCYQEPMILEYHTLSCIGDMTVGGLGAWLITEVPRFKNWIKTMRREYIALVYLTFIGVFFFRLDLLQQPIVIVFERMLIGVVIFLIIAEQCFAEKSLFKMSSFKRISKLGEITYGLYCLHFIGILIALTVTRILNLNTELWQVIVIETTLAFAISIAISKVSFHYFEKPFLKYKNRFAYITKD